MIMISILLILIILQQNTFGIQPLGMFASFGSSSNSLSPKKEITNHQLPDKVLVAYTTNHCNDLNDMSKVTNAIQNGVNVLIWSFIAFEVKDDGDLKISVSQNIDNYKLYRNQLVQMGYDSVVHLVSFGGWNGPHLPKGYSGDQLYEIFKNFNNQQNKTTTSKEYHFPTLWDGIDWDLEGHDNIQHPNNEFSVELLNQIGEFSNSAKKDGLLTSIAPPESYLDTTTSRFSRLVNLTYPNDDWHQDFLYHGWNVYAYIMAKYGEDIDFAFIQFYESYSHALYQTEKMKMSQSEFLVTYIKNLSTEKGFGYYVNFQDDKSIDMKHQFVDLPLSKIVFGFANGWALDSEKAIFFNPFEVQAAFDQLHRMNLVPRGCGYWVVEEEGKHDFFLTKELDRIVKHGNKDEDNNTLINIKA